MTKEKFITIICGVILIIGSFAFGYHNTYATETKKLKLLNASILNIISFGSNLSGFMGTKDKNIDISFDSNDNATVKFISTKYKGEPVNFTIHLRKINTPQGLGYMITDVTAIKPDGSGLSESDKECYTEFKKYEKDLGIKQKDREYLVR